MSCLLLVGRARRRSDSTLLIPMAKDELDCMSPLAALQQQRERDQQRQRQWHRRLSPLKRKPSASPTFTNSTASVSPQRRPASPEKSSKRPVYQQERMNGHGHGSFQEAWEQLRQSAADSSGGNAVEIGVGGGQRHERIPFSPSKPKPPPIPSPSSSKSSPLEMPDSVNPIGRIVPVSMMANGARKEPLGMAQNSASNEAMSSSILASPAWYRDREGRTGFKPDDFPHSNARIQSSPIKVIQAAQKEDNSIHQIKQMNLASSNEKIMVEFCIPPPCTPTTASAPAYLNTSASTLPLPSHQNCRQRHIPPSFHQPLHGLPPIAPNGGPFPLRRTNNTSELTNSAKMMNGTARQRPQSSSPIKDVLKELQQTEQLLKQCSPQKVVKFAETVQVTEIAPREEMESSLCSSNSSFSSSPSNSSSSDEEPFGARRQLKKPAQNGPRKPLARTNPPLAIVRPRQASTLTTVGSERDVAVSRVESEGKLNANGMAGSNGNNGTWPKLTTENDGQKKNASQPSWSDTANLERVIEQFFAHCQSLTTLNPSTTSESPKSIPLQQRSVYDNLADDDGGSSPKSAKNCAEPDWLHTKAKVLAQQSGGPLEWSRDGSPKRRVEMLVTSSNHNASQNVPVPAVRQSLMTGSGSNGQSQSTGIRKACSVEPLSRIPLPKSTAIRQTGNGSQQQSGNESSSSSSSTAIAPMPRELPPNGRQPGKTFAVVRSRSRF